MKNIIPFKKDISFKTNLSEITSISLENTLNLKNDTISGDFIVSGEYKVSENSNTVEPFELKLPFEIVLDDRYETSKAIIDIDNFYYEIINENTLSVFIDVLVDHLSEKPSIETEKLVDVTPIRTIIEEKEPDEEEKITNDLDTNLEAEEERCIEDDDIETNDSIENKLLEKVNDMEDNKEKSEIVEEKINSIFSNVSEDSEVYVTYNVFILREGDTLDSIMKKYNVTEDELKKYNDLSNLELGDKLIIPNNYERD